MRNLVLLNANERDPSQPDVPTMKDIGCQDAPALGYLVIGPKDLPDPVYKVLSDAIRKVAAGPDFQKALANLEIPFDYKDRAQLEKETVDTRIRRFLLLNAEGVFTELLRVVRFRRRTSTGAFASGMLAIAAGAAVLELARRGAPRTGTSRMLAVLGACLAWAVDNNPTSG